MKGARRLSGSLFPLVSIVGAVALLAATVAPVSANSGDWSLVSAPPPPGPYRSINLDPRVPGAEGIPMIGIAPTFSQSVENRAPVTPDAAPAAGGQANYQTQMNRLPPQAPGRYQSLMPRPPVNTRYPAQVGRQNYGTMPSRGYFPTHPYQAEEVVPPPPVYDAMMRSPPGANQGGTGR